MHKTAKTLDWDGRGVSRRAWLRMMAGVLSTGAAALAGGVAATAEKGKLECPANWEKGTRACKRARAERKCPELRGGKCLADEPPTAPTPGASAQTP